MLPIMGGFLIILVPKKFPKSSQICPLPENNTLKKKEYFILKQKNEHLEQKNVQNVHLAGDK